MLEMGKSGKILKKRTFLEIKTKHVSTTTRVVKKKRLL